MKRIYAALLVLFIGLTSYAQIRIPQVSAGEPFNVSITVTKATPCDSVSIDSTNVSGSHISIEMTYHRDPGMCEQVLTEEEFIVSIPAQSEGNYLIHTLLFKEFGLDTQDKAFSIPYPGDSDLGEWFDDPAMNYAFKGMKPNLTVKDNVIEYTHMKRNDDASLTYILEVCTNIAEDPQSNTGPGKERDPHSADEHPA